MISATRKYKSVQRLDLQQNKLSCQWHLARKTRLQQPGSGTKQHRLTDRWTNIRGARSHIVPRVVNFWTSYVQTPVLEVKSRGNVHWPHKSYSHLPTNMCLSGRPPPAPARRRLNFAADKTRLGPISQSPPIRERLFRRLSAEEA